MEKKQVYLSLYDVWCDVIDEDETLYAYQDIDGIVTYVIKDGQERIRVVDQC